MPTKLTEYNRLVLQELRVLNQEVADRLNSRGNQLGWWNSIRYWHSRGVTAPRAAELLLQHAHVAING